MTSIPRVDLKDLKTYQQLYLYFVPLVTNIGFINIIVVVIRLWWFRKHLKKLGEMDCHCLMQDCECLG